MHTTEKVQLALVRFLDDAESGLTAFARDTFSELYEQLKDLDSRIERVTRRGGSLRPGPAAAGPRRLARGPAARESGRARRHARGQLIFLRHPRIT